MTLRQLMPALVTLIALGCGMAALEATRVGSWDVALRLILLAAIADGIDGPLARRLKADSPMGKQLDSLSDIVAFGVAPAFLFATYYADAPDAARYGLALLFVGAGAYRLARFHAIPGNGFFQGLPITAAGALLAVAIAGPFTANVMVGGSAAVLLAVLMVGRHPFPKFAKWRWMLLPAFTGAAIPIALWPAIETLAILAAVVLGIYVVWGLVIRPIQERKHAASYEEDDGEDENPETPVYEGHWGTNGHGANGLVPQMQEVGVSASKGLNGPSFLRAFFRDRKTVGAVAPTSQGVARRMTRMAGIAEAKNVAEFGPGTGAITKALLQSLPADGRLWGFEVHPPFVDHLRESIDDPRFTVLAESVEGVAALKDREAEDGFDAIVSSIPFSLIGPEQTTEILRIVARTLRTGGVFVALQYNPRYLAPLLRAEFATVEKEVYPWNIPPATLLRAHTPFHAAEPVND